MPLSEFSPDFEVLKKFIQGKGNPEDLVFFEWFIDPGVATGAAGRFFEPPDRAVLNRAVGPTLLSGDEDEADASRASAPKQGECPEAERPIGEEDDAFEFECSVRLARLLRLHNLPYSTCQKILHMIPKPDPDQPAGGPTLLSGDFGAKDIAWNDICLGPFGVGSPFDMVDWQGGIALASHRYLEDAANRLPDGMLLSVAVVGVLHIAAAILGDEQFYLGLYTEPEWMDEFMHRLVDATVESVEQIVQYPATGCLVIGEDMGSTNGLLIAPDILKKYSVDSHRRCVEIAHSRDIPVVLHSCGNCKDIMACEIETAGIDAKQSFDDKSVPVEKFKSAFGDRVVTLGGLDMDILSGSDESKIRARTAEIMQSCWGDGRYAMGSGHCVATYTPIENFLIMQDEAIKTWRALRGH